MINTVNGGQKNVLAANSLKANLAKMRDSYSGTAHFGFALSEIDEEKVIVDALIVSKEKGILAVNFTTGDIEYDIEQSDRIYILLRGLLEKNSALRNRKELAISIQCITYGLEKIDEDEFVDEASFVSFYESLPQFDEKYFEPLNESLDRIVSAKPKKLRNNVQKENSFGAKIKKIEKQIANMDEWQKEAAYEVPNRPQRIRGLAGSGKTVVLALKAAYLHFLDGSTDIAVTFYSRSLYEQYKKMIQDFYAQYSGGGDVDFTKVHLLHTWGTTSEPGVYSVVSEKVGATVYTYNEAVMKYGRSKAFEGICDNLESLMKMQDINSLKMFDHILIDEAQDLPSSFFKICYRLFKDNDKRRLVFAYDELQNLNQKSMPSLSEMFGVDERGNDIVEVGNEDEGDPKTDILLPMCYRNSKWTLSLAHALGFGIYRNVEKPLVQFFEDLEVWKKIGYEVIEGKLEYGAHVKLSRSMKATPKYFDELLTAEEAVVVHSKFSDREEEYKWIAKQIKKNIEDEELDPDDILVIFPNPLTAKKYYAEFVKILQMVGISSIMPGVNVDRDTFSQNGCITCTHIYRAKGNEKPMVYLADADYGSFTADIVQVRNVLFTAITRSRAWIRITGVGYGMDLIEAEINKCKSNNYILEFDVPSEKEIRELNLLNKGNSKQRGNQILSGEKATDDLIQLLRQGEFNLSDIPNLQDLYEVLKGISGE